MAAPVLISVAVTLITGGFLPWHRWKSRRQLAEALDVHYQTVGYLERGEYSPSLYLALRIAAYFEVPVEVIFSAEPFPRIGSVGISAS